MSGICGVWRKDDRARAPYTLKLVSAGCSLEKVEKIATAAVEEGAGVGVAARFEGQQLYQDARVLLASDADLFNEDELRAVAGTPLESSGASLLAALYKKLGTRFVEKLRGDFSVIV